MTRTPLAARLALETIVRILVIFLAVSTAFFLAPAQAQLTFSERGGSFAGQVNYAVGGVPYRAVVADFNADGKSDVVTGNYEGDSISILMGNGDGTFATSIALPAGDGTESPVVADFDGDGKLDIAAANLLDSTISIFLGNGAGGFAAPASYGVGFNPHAVVVADLNGDGKLDVASADGSQGTISLLLGTGSGTFLPATQIGTDCPNPRDLVTADFDGNGSADFALTCQGAASIAILLGNGVGGFGAPTLVPVGMEPFGISLGNFDAGTSADLAVAVIGSDKVAILLGNGNGTFTAGMSLSGIYRPRDTRAADLDADGNQDLMVVDGADNLILYMGNGSGNFSAGTAFPVSGIPSSVASGDFNGDGKPDLVVTGSQNAVAGILLNISTEPLNIAPSATIEAGSSYTFRKVPLWINRQTSGVYPAGFPYSHAGYLDLDQDGDVDFARTFADNSTVFQLQVMINDGNGNFSDQTATRIIGGQPGTRTPRKVLIGDYNGDLWPDVLVVGHGTDAPPFQGEFLQLFLSNANGTLSYRPGLEPYVDYHHGGASADIDGNGTIDIFTNANNPYFLLNDGQGHFTQNNSRVPRAPGNLRFRPISSELIDVDGDGYIDLVADGYEPDGLSNAVYWGSSSGAYLYSNRSVLAPVPDMGVTLDFAAEDIDGDGLRDLIVLRTGSTDIYIGRYIQILRQTNARVFADQTAARISFDRNLPTFDYIRAQDFNGDGFVDLFIDDKNDMASGQYAWTNNGQGIFAPYTGPVSPAWPSIPFLSVGNATITEGDDGTKSATFTVRLSHTSANDVTYSIATADGSATAGSDYVAHSLAGDSIAAGLTGTTFEVTIIGDQTFEPDETFTVNLTATAGAALDDAQGTGTITNDDNPNLIFQNGFDGL